MIQRSGVVAWKFFGSQLNTCSIIARGARRTLAVRHRVPRREQLAE
jgi:hypothetical protein